MPIRRVLGSATMASMGIILASSGFVEVPLGQLWAAALLVAVAAVTAAAVPIRRRWRQHRNEEAAVRGARPGMGEPGSPRGDPNSVPIPYEEHLGVIAEVSLSHLFVFGPDGAAIYVSPGFSDLTGLSSERLMGLGWTEALHADDRAPISRAWLGGIEGGRPFEAECRILEAGAGHRWFRLRAVPVRSEGGEILRWMGAATDIHDRREAIAVMAAALVDADSGGLKDEFLDTVSHELRTPLNAIVGWVYLLKTGALSGRETQQAIDAIDRNAHSQVRLIDDLLDISRLERGRVSLDLASCDLRALVEGVVATLEPAVAAKQLVLDVQGDMTGLVVTGDERRLRQVVWSLLSNAVKFTPRGGRIVADVRRRAGQVLLGVSDSGDGIERTLLPNVFDTFRQGASRWQRTGLGVGLAIARNLVELHGGTLTAESGGAGRGAVFTVSLPVPSQEPPQRNDESS